MTDTMPDEARGLLSHIDRKGLLVAGELRRALETLANMRVEHDHGVVDWEQVDGRYETRHRVRLVSDWRDA